MDNKKTAINQCEELTQKILFLEDKIISILSKKEELENATTKLLVSVMNAENWQERCKLGRQSDIMIKECEAMRVDLEKLKFELEVAKHAKHNINNHLVNAELQL